MEKVKVLLDTNVLISALLSQTGASYELINNQNIIKISSSTIKAELIEVSRRLNIQILEVQSILRKINVKPIGISKVDIIKLYSEFVTDMEDSHVLASAVSLKSKFLLTHNTKHYKEEKIKSDFGIIVIKPGFFLQFLRSQTASLK